MLIALNFILTLLVILEHVVIITFVYKLRAMTCSQLHRIFSRLKRWPQIRKIGMISGSVLVKLSMVFQYGVFILSLVPDTVSKIAFRLKLKKIILTLISSPVLTPPPNSQAQSVYVVKGFIVPSTCFLF